MKKLSILALVLVMLAVGQVLDRAPPAVATKVAPSIDAGIAHTCALRADGTVRCWGRNLSGQLGDGSNESSNTPVQVSGLSDAVAVTTGANHTCALLADGTVRCWGTNAFGQLGDGTYDNSNTPVQVSGLSEAVAVAAGGEHSCAVLADGTAWCWGCNTSGQLGDGGYGSSRAPVQVSGLSHAVAVAAGFSHTCALLADSTVWCWGSNYYGELGDGSPPPVPKPLPVTVSGVSDAVAVTAGDGHSCALLAYSTVWCWGRNESGQLGDGTNTNRNTPVQVYTVDGPYLWGVAGIAAGSNHTCALSVDILSTDVHRRVGCWGNNSGGELGDGTYDDRNLAPGDTPGSELWAIEGAAAVAAGGYDLAMSGGHTCAVLADGTARCWGRNSSGQLGDGTNTQSNVPVFVSPLARAAGRTIDLGLEYSCAVLGDGIARCWGRNLYGQLGDGTNTDSNTPVPAAGLTATIAAGRYHTCADPGGVWCWGRNDKGQLGDGNMGTDSNVPVPVSLWCDDYARALAAGGYHSCAARAYGDVFCWGRNDKGQLGDGHMGTDSDIPVQVSGLGGYAVAVAAGYSHTCAVLADGTARCWGDNGAGRLGDGTTTDSDTPVQVSGLTNAVAIAAGDGHSCALRADGVVGCWGANDYGQLGDGNMGTDSDTPVQVSGLTNAVAIAAGNNHTCAIRDDGTAWCWGRNNEGQLGNGDTTDSDVPVQVQGLPLDAIAIDGGMRHTCALLSDGSARCWGWNPYGQLGDGTNDDSVTPVQVIVPADTDSDGCADEEEYGLGANFGALAWYDVYDVPVAAVADPTPNGPRNSLVDIGDVLGVLFYAFADDDGPANANGVDYDTIKGSCDWNGDTTADEEGLCYDRSPGLDPDPVTGIDPAGAPNGVMDVGDVLACLAQAFIVDCTGPP